MKRILQKLLTDQQGATVVEYGLILAFVFLAIMFSVRSVANQTVSMWNSIAHETGAMPTNPN